MHNSAHNRERHQSRVSTNQKTQKKGNDETRATDRKSDSKGDGKKGIEHLSTPANGSCGLREGHALEGHVSSQRVLWMTVHVPSVPLEQRIPQFVTLLRFACSVRAYLRRAPRSLVRSPNGKESTERSQLQLAAQLPGSNLGVACGGVMNLTGSLSSVTVTGNRSFQHLISIYISTSNHGKCMILCI